MENYRLGWAWGMAILAAILEFAGLGVTRMSQTCDSYWPVIIMPPCGNVQFTADSSIVKAPYKVVTHS